jgi:hypothetical protein
MKGGQNNEERSGDFDREGTLAKEQAQGRINDAQYNRMMHEAPEQDEGKFKLPKVTVPKRSKR